MLSILGVSVYALVDAELVSRSATVDSEIIEAAKLENGKLFGALEHDSEYVIGWLNIYNTHINYPITQGKDNAWFLNRNYRGEFATAGSIFLDYRNQNDFTDNFSIIYGHRMGNGEMFSDIHYFEDKKYFNEHQEGLLRLRGVDIPISIVAYAKIDARDWTIYNAEKSRNDNNVVSYIFKLAKVRGGYVDMDGDYILLSTCDGSEKDKRDVLLARLVRG